MKVIIMPRKGRHFSIYYVKKGELLVKEKAMMKYADNYNVEVERIYSPIVGATGYKFTGTDHKMLKVAKACISWGGR